MIQEWNPDDLLAPALPGGDAPAPQRGALDLLLDGAEDDERAVDPTDEEFASLEDEWRVLAVLKERRDRLEASLKAVKESYEAQKDRMRRAMEAQGTRQYASAAGRGAASIAREYRTKVMDQAAFMRWVGETHPELLSVNSQTRDSFVRNQFRDQGVPPDDPSFPPGLEVVEQEVLRVRSVRAANQEDRG